MRIATLLVLCALPATVSAGAPAQATVTVELEQKRRLRIVEWVYDKKEPGIVGIDGVLVATITNRTPEPVVIRELENHGVVFTDVRTKRDHVMIHSCKCAKDHQKPDAITLMPGDAHVVAIDEWGCSGSMWSPPPPGPYQVRYRVMKAAPIAPETPDERPPIAELIDACRETLLSPRTEWLAVSEPVGVKLGKAFKRKAPR